jgi:hypothetical protein
VYLFVLNLVGLGLGPTAVAVLTDYVFRADAAVGRSLAIVGGAGLLDGVLCLRAGRAPYRIAVERRASEP